MMLSVSTLAYKAEAVELQKQLRHLQSQFDVLTAHGSTLVQGRRARVSATSTVNGHLTTLDDSLSARNLQFWKGYLQQHKIWLFIILEKTIPALCWELAQLQDTYILQAAAGKQEQGAVDDQDTFLHGVRDLLSSHSSNEPSFLAGLSTYVSAPRIVQQISSLHSDLMTLQSDLKNSLPQDIKCINELLQQLLFPSSTTAQLILAPCALMKELDGIEKINAKLSAAVEEATLEHCKKSEIIKHHSQEVGLQRRVFVDFVCSPERLRSQVPELTARVRGFKAF
ncbi:AUGMIN subunit 3 [Citrus sinensis]|uniref:AUGMIN subunit 3 n=1 Tax=Citrus sinensis TaxID=2711 RepID=A0ACB8N8H7_CITSI|nr:AUGMIN subunit 3 [Citrus sinensis]